MEGVLKMADTIMQHRCAACGAPINPPAQRQYCAGCLKALQRERNRERYRGANKKPRAEITTYVRPRRTGRMFDCSGKDLAGVALEARALGMTYGQFTSACAAGTIERKLAMQGISREVATRLVVNAKRRKTAARKKKTADH